MASEKDDHAGSGIDKPDPKGILEKVNDKLKEALAPKPGATPPKSE